MLKKLLMLSSLFLPLNVFAHTGFHNGIVHPDSGVDHFLVMLIISLLAIVASYWYLKNK